VDGEPDPPPELAVAVGGVVGEVASAGTFFLLPFGLGAAIACVLAFVGAPLALQWLVFVGVSTAAVAGMRPLARRLDNSPSLPSGVGASRWVGQTAVVLQPIPAGTESTGLVRIGGEQWRAQTRHGVPVPTGSEVLVVDVVGTRLVVLPLEIASEGES
jgi:membrane protein implicated in regulation of membrane protease activity